MFQKFIQKIWEGLCSHSLDEFAEKRNFTCLLCFLGIFLRLNFIMVYLYFHSKHMSPVNNFTTPLLVGDQTSYKFIIYGDMGVDPYPEAVTTAKLISKEINNNDIRFIFHNGDISYARGYVRNFFYSKQFKK